ncbi:uncharacterized protein DUF4893 [Blastomonas natatoria]|uniref:Uncharacterized protein DUF4893 n=1 Tax=Blastomonas natatoria TaxID=34015 RepID=A0A2V3VBJ2_9SPHN|nr:DUF4893 domain-containing protein [Blastomonas natatoria]PXW79067.1 uncharacterized protein DUF4893 [Blastomonas natatoria]
MATFWKAVAASALMVSASAASAERWQDIATPADAARIKQRDATFAAAIKEVRNSEHAGALANNPSLYDPDKRLDDPLPPEGKYLCATHKLGGQFLAFIAYPDFACAIYGSGDKRQFVKLTGSQRPVGYIHADTRRNGVFLGSLMLGDDEGLVPYGQDRERDLAGTVERIGKDHWRIVFPRPYYESTMDIIDLRPRK